jgi:hypothetical protein
MLFVNDSRFETQSCYLDKIRASLLKEDCLFICLDLLIKPKPTLVAIATTDRHSHSKKFQKNFIKETLFELLNKGFFDG